MRLPTTQSLPSGMPFDDLIKQMALYGLTLIRDAVTNFAEDDKEQDISQCVSTVYEGGLQSRGWR